MKKTLCVVSLLFYVFSGFGQVVDTAAVVREVDSLEQEARKLIDVQKFEEAFRTLDTAENILLRTIGKENASYAKCRLRRGIVFGAQTRFSEAEPFLVEANEINERILGNENPLTAVSKHQLGAVYRALSQYEKALDFSFQSKNIREKIFGKNSPQYAENLQVIATIYQETGQYEQSELFFKEAISIFVKTIGKENPNYLWSINNLANLYVLMAQYERAEELHLEAMNLRKKTLGKNSLDYAGSLVNLARLYGQMGQHEKVETYAQECSDIIEKTVGKENPFYIYILDLQSRLYYVLGQYDRTENILTEANQIIKKVLGEKHINYATNLHFLGQVYAKTGRLSKAEQYYSEALEIWEATVGKEHAFFMWTLGNLANLYLEMGQYEKAEALHSSLKDLKAKILGNDHPDYSITLDDLANLYLKTGRNKEALPLLTEKAGLEQASIIRASRHLSEVELSAYLKLFNQASHSFFSFAWFNLNDAFLTTGTCFDNILFYKGFAQNASLKMRQFASANPALVGQYNSLTSYYRKLSAEYSKPLAERKNVANLEETANTLEKELTRTVAGFGESNRQVTWPEVQAALQPDEAALEFIHFNYYTPDATDSVLYAALLLKPGMEQPLFIPLFEEKQLKSFLPKGGDKLNSDQVNELYGNSALYDLIWSPVEPHLQGVRTIYQSPGGLLHRLNLAALPAGGQTTLADRYDVVTLGSTRQLVVDHQPEGSLSSTALVYGGIQFETDNKSNTTPTGTPNGNRGSLDFSTVDSTLRSFPVYESGWDYLKGSEKEADNIKSVLTKAGYSAEVRKGGQASEESFKKIGQGESSPRILHVSTHGYFFPDPKTVDDRRRTVDGAELVFKISDHPMIRSGLILAGANHAWKTGKPLGNREDGVLTAYEISQLDLRNTELVVLSACETGLGQIEGNEGLYGLQRAFKIAGAKNLIMSLWQVQDNQTQELMTYFYQKLLIEKLPVRQALRAAQAEMRRQRYEPFYWAGFVVVE